ncbi:DUF2155 domain-containing protein [Rickettsiales endosymbiont of Stachyamoeba lipophora]|uniref:DUF2155 domain-containing protein n=1 Tax=Rickettsiales endosymbiont of Stachyamoeba lipophora TaxID=2486578 RepID=UPI000F650298|nr:DUF2155 domain-containing protein [Rickettsiales endosymbiont of Stachyamoeba lipophora]
MNLTLAFIQPVFANNELDSLLNSYIDNEEEDVEPYDNPQEPPSHQTQGNNANEANSLDEMLNGERAKGYQTTSKATVIYLDKLYTKKTILTLNIGEEKPYKNIQVSVEKCLTKINTPYKSNLALIKIIEDNKIVFHGWISKEFRALNYIANNPYYDILLDSCLDN